jgi:hypothetical protein
VAFAAAWAACGLDVAVTAAIAATSAMSAAVEMSAVPAGLRRRANRS